MNWYEREKKKWKKKDSSEKMRRLIRAKYWRCSHLWFHHPRTPNCDTVERRKIQIANSLPVQYSSCTIKSLQVAAPLPQSIGSPSSSKFSNCLKDEASRWTHLFIKSPSLSTNHHHWNKTTWTLKIITRSRQKDRHWLVVESFLIFFYCFDFTEKFVREQISFVN